MKLWLVACLGVPHGHYQVADYLSALPHGIDQILLCCAAWV